MFSSLQESVGYLGDWFSSQVRGVSDMLESYDDSPGGRDTTDMTADQNMPPLEKIRRYLRGNDIIAKLYVLHELSELVALVGVPTTTAQVLPILQEVAESSDSVIRQALVEQLPGVIFLYVESMKVKPLALLLGDDIPSMGVDGATATVTDTPNLLQPNEAAHEAEACVLSVLLPMIQSLVVDTNAPVRQSAGRALINTAKLLDSQLVEEHILGTIGGLASNMIEEEHRVDAAELLHELAPLLPADRAAPLLLPLATALSGDPLFRVRKATAFHLGSLGQILGEDAAVDRLLPLYVELCRDEIWGVRKACADTLVSMAKAVPLDIRSSAVVPLFETLAKDLSPWVRSSALHRLGMFIATFASQQTLDLHTQIAAGLNRSTDEHRHFNYNSVAQQDTYNGGLMEVSPQLLTYFLKMAPTRKGEGGNGGSSSHPDGDTVLCCAFNFPGVLLTVGRDTWPTMKKAYFTLTRDLQWKVRRTLSYSLHEVARILGTATAEASLLPTFELFMNDLDPVKVGVVKHLAEFLRMLRPKTRQNYLPTLLDLVSEATAWRFRELIAGQLGTLASLYDIDEVVSTILPIALQLMRDPVQSVRIAISVQIAPLLHRLTGPLAPVTAAGACSCGGAAVEGGDKTSTIESSMESIDLNDDNANVGDDETKKQAETVSGAEDDERLSIASRAKSDLVEGIVAFAHGSTCTDRQIYVRVCGHLLMALEDRTALLGTFLPAMLALKDDRVPNVRFALARALTDALAHVMDRLEETDEKEVKEQLEEKTVEGPAKYTRRRYTDDAGVDFLERVEGVVRLLCQDRDRDVVFYARRHPTAAEVNQETETEAEVELGENECVAVHDDDDEEKEEVGYSESLPLLDSRAETTTPYVTTEAERAAATSPTAPASPSKAAAAAAAAAAESAVEEAAVVAATSTDDAASTSTEETNADTSEAMSEMMSTYFN
eukprot:TRINITY_DN319_c0_g3_i1.p1 TRINITY_DN319_c0_g3~~TRINITY_DN319_c0_g3_i1.p1  ORF type:complete len:947 (-),score=225.84 TRINITY_DN319_c0_g3_i1:2-2842(-)